MILEGISIKSVSPLSDVLGVPPEPFTITLDIIPGSSLVPLSQLTYHLKGNKDLILMLSYIEIHRNIYILHP